MHIEQFKGKKIAVYGLDNIGKLFVNFLNKNAISVVILDESDIDYSIFQNQELITSLSSNKVNWRELECLVINNTNETLNSLAEKNNCQVYSILDFFKKYFTEYNYIGLIGKSGFSITSFLLKHFLYKYNMDEQRESLKYDTCIDLDKFGKNNDCIIQLNDDVFKIIQGPRLNSLIIFDLDYEKSALDKIEKMILKQENGDFTILNMDNKEVKELYKELKDDERIKTQLIPISANKIIDNGISLINNEFYINVDNRNEEFLADTFASLIGEQNKINILATLALLIKKNYNPQEVIENIHNYKGVGEVFEIILQKENFVFVDDIKNKNKFQSLITFDNIYWLLCIDEPEFELDEFVKLQKHFHKLKYVFIIGKHNETITNLFDDNDVKYSIMYDMETSLQKLKELLKDEKKEEKIIILLSSINNLEDNEFYKVNGEIFDKIIKREEDNEL